MVGVILFLSFMDEDYTQALPYKNLSLEDMEGEVWKDIKGLDGLYKVSNKGRIKAMQSIRKFGNKKRRHREHIIKQFPNWAGYLHCAISDINQIKHKIIVHKCVAEHFLSKPSDAQCVNHKDENKQNNCVENLEFCTFSYNLNYGSRNGWNCHAVAKCDLEGNIIAQYNSIREAAKAMRRVPSAISNCLMGVAHTCGGYKWKLI